jgi:hypothetical protein
MSKLRSGLLMVTLIMALGASSACGPTGGPGNGDKPPAAAPGARPGPGPGPGPQPGPPGGAPVGVQYDLPTAPDDLKNRPKWISKFAQRCQEAGKAADCLKVKYVFFEASYPDYKQKSLKADPGDNYDTAVWDNCTLTKINPPTGSSKKIKSGSTVTFTVVCERVYNGNNGTNGTNKGTGSGNRTGRGGTAVEGSGNQQVKALPDLGRQASPLLPWGLP